MRSPLKGVENMSVSAHPAAACAGEQPQAQRPRYTEVLRVKKLNADAILPTRGSAGAAGYDLSRCCTPRPPRDDCVGVP